MTKKTITISIVLSIILISLTGFVLFSQKEKTMSEPIELGLTTIELADESEEHSRGLMNRNELCEKCGMLFIFKTQQIRSFWMKNTLIPLDIIFINEDGIVEQVHKNTKTNQTSERYSSVKPIKYVLETNSGFSEKKGLVKGDTIDISRLKENGIDYQY